MKKTKSILCLLMSICILASASTVFGTSYAKLYYFTGSGQNGPGVTSSVKTLLSDNGYSASRYSNKSKSTVISGMAASTVFHILTHGSSGSFSASDGSITASTITGQVSSLSGLTFAFIEACNTGSSSSFLNTLSSLGVTCSLSFSNEITASSDSNGIHYFTKRVYDWMLVGGYSASNAVIKAKTDTWNAYTAYYGCNYYVLRNNTYI